MNRKEKAGTAAEIAGGSVAGTATGVLIGSSLRDKSPALKIVSQRPAAHALKAHSGLTNPNKASSAIDHARLDASKFLYKGPKHSGKWAAVAAGGALVGVAGNRYKHSLSKADSPPAVITYSERQWNKKMKKLRKARKTNSPMVFRYKLARKYVIKDKVSKGAAMYVSPFGVVHSDIQTVSKAQKPASGGRYAAGMTFPGWHGAVAGKPGKKLRSVGSEVGGAVGGQIAGSALGGAASMAVPGKAKAPVALGGMIGGALTGRAMGVHHAQKMGNYKRQR